MELEISWKRTIKIWWAYVWRNLIAIVISFFLGWILGFILGSILGFLGVPIRTIQLIISPIGGILGLLISIIPMKMILGKDFGEFRLVLLKKE